MSGSAIVIGAGIGGLAAALALARAGWTVEVREQAENANEVGAGLQLGPNAVKVLDALDIGGPLRSAASAPARIEMRDDRSWRRIAEVHMGAAAEARYGAPYLQIHRADLLSILIDAVLAAGVRLTFGTRIEGWAEKGEADVIVAADGVRSALRGPVSGASTPLFSGKVAWRALVPAAEIEGGPPADATLLALGPGRHLVAYTLRGRSLWNIVAVVERDEWAEEGWRAEGDPDALRAAFADVAPEIRSLLDKVESCILWGLFGHRPLPRWTRDNVALLGDAAHPMLPFMAQGAAMAIEDAAVLARSLAQGPVETALERYERARKPRATRLQATARHNATLYHMPLPVIRQGLHGAIGLRALFPGGLLSRFDWLYGADVLSDVPPEG